MGDGEKWPRKLFLIGRMGLTLKSYLQSPLGHRFYDASFLEGVCKQRIQVRKELGKLATSCFGLTTILAFFHLLPSEIKLFGNSITVSKELFPLIGAMTSISFFGMVIKIADDLIIDRYINIIFENAKLYSPKLILTNYVSIDLWTEVITPKFFGPKSGYGYIGYFLILFLQLLIMFVIFLIYPTAFICLSLYEIYNNNENLSFSNVSSENIGYYILFLFMCLVLLLTYTIILALCFRYKFLRPDFDEGTSEPTSEFLKELSQKDQPR